MYRLRLLGVIELLDGDGMEVRAVLAQPKCLPLLAYLALGSADGSRRRDTVQGLFWPELDPEHARNALNQAIHFLRQAIGRDAIVSPSEEELSIDPAVVWCDATAFEAAVLARDWAGALAFWRVDLMRDLVVSDAPAFGEWLKRQRARFRAMASAAARALAEEQEHAGRVAAAADFARRAADLAVDDERGLRELLELLDRLGDRAGAEHAYATFADHVAKEYAAEPSAETKAIIARVRAREWARAGDRGGARSAPLTVGVGDPTLAFQHQLQDALGDRYLIERELGGGGMSRVFVATEQALGRKVVLKVLPAERAEGVSGDRFKREIRVAAGLSHPHIVPLLSAGHVVGLPYYTMPFVEGTSLRERVAAGPLSIEETVAVLRDVGQALVYAHAHGIVHRDIKPGNVLLTGDSAVVTDFGVSKAIDDARASEDGPSITLPGVVPGTPAYVAPEQVASDPAMDHRVDIYALGVLAFELLTGKPPFHDRTNQELLRAHLTERPPSVASLRADTPPALAALVMQCLAKEPAARPQRVEDVLRELPPALGAARPRRPRLRAVFAVLLLFVLPFFLIREGTGRPASEHLAAPRYVAVLSFTSTDSADVVLAAGLTQSFTQLLARLAPRGDSLWVLSFEDMLDAAANSPAELRRSYPVDLVVTGEVRSTGGIRTLKTDLLDVRTDSARIVSSLVLGHPSDSLAMASVHALLSPVVALLAPSGAGRDSGAVWGASPARRYYLVGAGHMQRAYDLGSLAAAIDNFEAAIKQDAAFGPAYAGLCEALWERYLQTGQASLANDATRMCDRAGELSRSDPAALVALGRTQFFQGDLGRAEQTLRDAIRRNAGADGHRWLGQVFEDLGRFEAAEREHRQAIALRPDVWIYHAGLGMLYMNTDRHAEAMAVHRDVIRLSPDNYVGYSNLGASLMLTNRLGEAEEQLRRSLQMRPTSLAYRNLGYHGLLRQRHDDAVAALREAIRYGPEDWWSWRWLANAHHWRGEQSAARDAWQRVVDLLKLRLDFNPTNQDMLCGMAEASVALGDTIGGQRYLNSLSSRPIIKSYNLYWTGRVYEMLGRREEALQLITQALERGFDSHTVAADPWLRALRTDARYHGPQQNR
jgi:eukaryotic-like serine/threonine-protein kinase